MHVAVARGGRRRAERSSPLFFSLAHSVDPVVAGAGSDFEPIALPGVVIPVDILSCCSVPIRAVLLEYSFDRRYYSAPVMNYSAPVETGAIEPVARVTDVPGHCYRWQKY